MNLCQYVRNLHLCAASAAAAVVSVRQLLEQHCEPFTHVRPIARLPAAQPAAYSSSSSSAPACCCSNGMSWECMGRNVGYHMRLSMPSLVVDAASTPLTLVVDAASTAAMFRRRAEVAVALWLACKSHKQGTPLLPMHQAVMVPRLVVVLMPMLQPFVHAESVGRRIFCTYPTSL